MKGSIEQILIVYASTDANGEGTRESDMLAVRDIINSFGRSGRPSDALKTSAFIYRTSETVTAGETLSSQLRDVMQASLGAIVFLDRIPANVAYEMGFFHGQGRPVLLLTRAQDRAEIWRRFSDITGSPLYVLEDAPPTEVVNAYLGRLYSELSRVEPWNVDEFPSAKDNLLNRETTKQLGHLILKDSPEFGKALSIPGWGRVDLDVGMNLLQDAKFKIVVRSIWPSSHLTIYFLIRYTTLSGEQKRIYTALSSATSVTYARSNERTVPLPRATSQWQLVSGRFQDLMKQGMILDVLRVDHLDKIAFRAGFVEGTVADGVLDESTAVSHDEPLEVGFIQVVGALE